jgi:hypothetical protein
VVVALEIHHPYLPAKAMLAVAALTIFVMLILIMKFFMDIQGLVAVRQVLAVQTVAPAAVAQIGNHWELIMLAAAVLVRLGTMAHLLVVLAAVAMVVLQVLLIEAVVAVAEAEAPAVLGLSLFDMQALNVAQAAQ